MELSKAQWQALERLLHNLGNLISESEYINLYTGSSPNDSQVEGVFIDAPQWDHLVALLEQWEEAE